MPERGGTSPLGTHINTNQFSMSTTAVDTAISKHRCCPALTGPEHLGASTQLKTLGVCVSDNEFSLLNENNEFVTGST